MQVTEETSRNSHLIFFMKVKEGLCTAVHAGVIALITLAFIYI